MFKDGAEAGLWGDLLWDRGADVIFLETGFFPSDRAGNGTSFG
jgi:hypothetical protein